jgi:hypothetical protein
MKKMSNKIEQNEIVVSHKELEKTIHHIFNVNKNLIGKKKVALYIWGTTGIGKSDKVVNTSSQLAKENSREFVDWNRLSKEEKYKVADNVSKYFILFDYRLSSKDITDLMGLPNLNGKDTVEWKVPLWLSVACKKNAMGIIFFDELNLAPSSIQTQGYQLIRDGCLGEVSLSDGITIMSAGNTIDDRANVYDLPKPLQNRFIHLVLKVPDLDDWVEWAVKNNVDKRIIAFLNFKPTYLMKFDPDSKDKSFATPRSWGEFCSNLIKDVKDELMLEILTSSAIGSGVATEFTAFIKMQKELKLSDFLSNPEKVKTLSIDLKWSITSLLSNWFKTNNTPDDVKKLLTIIDFLESEYAILTLRFMREENKVIFKNRMIKSDLWVKKLSQQYAKFLWEEVVN